MQGALAGETKAERRRRLNRKYAQDHRRRREERIVNLEADKKALIDDNELFRAELIRVREENERLEHNMYWLFFCRNVRPQHFGMCEMLSEPCACWMDFTTPDFGGESKPFTSDSNLFTSESQA
jgi:hypothetical protein